MEDCSLGPVEKAASSFSCGCLGFMMCFQTGLSLSHIPQEAEGAESEDKQRREKQSHLTPLFNAPRWLPSPLRIQPNSLTDLLSPLGSASARLPPHSRLPLEKSSSNHAKRPCAYSCLWAFSYSVPSVWNTFPSLLLAWLIPSHPLDLCFYSVLEVFLGLLS